MERMLKNFWILGALILTSTAAGAESWESVIRKISHNSKSLSLTSNLQQSPSYRVTAKVVTFSGILKLPSHVYLYSGTSKIHNSAGQIIIDNRITCNYSPKSSKSREFHLVDCSDGSRAGDEMIVDQKIVLKLNQAASDQAALFAKLSIVRSENVSYGLIFPYLSPVEGNILMFNGSAWVSADPSEIQGLRGEAGLPGLKGEPGVAGPQGPKGENGLAGAPGATGPQGPKGDNGLAGAPGATGLQGPKGDNGLAGGPGATGPQGEAGVQGAKGEKGDRGLAEIAYLRDEKNTGLAGGGCTQDIWHTRSLNMLGGNSSFISLSNNRFTLAPGKYFVEASAPLHGVNLSQAKLIVVETGTDVLIGTAAKSISTSQTVSYSLIQGELIVSAPSSFEIKQRCQTTRANDGFGVASGWNAKEIYTQIKIIKTE